VDQQRSDNGAISETVNILWHNADTVSPVSILQCKNANHKKKLKIQNHVA